MAVAVAEGHALALPARKAAPPPHSVAGPVVMVVLFVARLDDGLQAKQDAGLHGRLRDADHLRGREEWGGEEAREREGGGGVRRGRAAGEKEGFLYLPPPPPPASTLHAPRPHLQPCVADLLGGRPYERLLGQVACTEWEGEEEGGQRGAREGRLWSLRSCPPAISTQESKHTHRQALTTINPTETQ